MVYKPGGFAAAQSLVGTIPEGQDFRTRIHSKFSNVMKEKERETVKRKAAAEQSEREYTDLMAKQKDLGITGRIEQAMFGVEEDDSLLEKGFKSAGKLMAYPLTSTGKFIEGVGKERVKETISDIKTPSLFPAARLAGNFVELIGEAVGEGAKNVFGMLPESVQEKSLEGLKKIAGQGAKVAAFPITSSLTLISNLMGDKTTMSEMEDKLLSEGLSLIGKGSGKWEEFKNKNEFTKGIANDIEGLASTLTGLTEIKAIAMAGSKLAGSKLTKGLISKLDDFGKIASKQVDEITPQAFKKAGTFIDQPAISEITGETIEAVGKQVDEITPIIAKKSEKELKSIQKMIEPVANKKRSIAALQKGTGPGGIKETGILKKWELAPSKELDEMVEISSKVMDSKKGVLQNIDNLKSAIGKQSNDVSSAISKVNRKITKQEKNSLLDAIDTLEPKDYIKSETNLQNQYDLVKGRLKEAVEDVDTIEDVFNSRKRFDDIIDNQFGAKIFDPDKNTALKDSILDGRRTMNEFTNVLVGDDIVKKNLNEMHNYYKTIYNMAESNYKLQGKNFMARWMKLNPAKAGLIKKGTGYAGAGLLGGWILGE